MYYMPIAVYHFNKLITKYSLFFFDEYNHSLVYFIININILSRVWVNSCFQKLEIGCSGGACGYGRDDSDRSGSKCGNGAGRDSCGHSLLNL